MRSNNLNTLRLIGACLVLYGHSFIFLGLREPLFLSWLPLGSLGVNIFFTISGYLIAASWENDPHLLRFLARRSLRIFPALVVCIALSALVLGPMLTTLSLSDYFKHEYTWGYFRNITLYISYTLPGVFETNRVQHAVNGSLWSLPIEFLLYFVVALLGIAKGSRWVFASAAITSLIATYFWARHSDMTVIYASDLRQVFLCGTYFWVGAVFYKFDLKRFLSISTFALACIAMICLEAYPALLSVAAWLLLPVVVLAFGLSSNSVLTWITQARDYSYGIYIYAFPVQQTIVHYYPNIQIEFYLPICFFLILVCASFSWHFIESPALKLKPRKLGNC